MVSSIITLFLVFLTLLVMMGVGRLAFVHTGACDDAAPLPSLVTGAGAWYVWFLLLNAGFGVSLPVVWGTFMVSAFALLVVLNRTYKEFEKHVLLWPLAGLVILLLLPVMVWQLKDTPQLWVEFAQHLKNAEHFFQLGGLPTAENVAFYDIFNAAAPVAGHMLSLPVFVMAQGTDAAVYTVINTFVLGLVVAFFPRLVGVRLGWHNIVFVAAVCLSLLIAFNPFFDFDLATAATPDVLIMASLLAVLSPLLRTQALPRGAQTIPYGLMFAFLVGMDPRFLWLGAALLPFWIVRAFASKRSLVLDDFFGWVNLVAIPTATALFWYVFTARASLGHVPRPDLSLWGEGIARHLETLLILLQNEPWMWVVLALSLGLGVMRLLTFRRLTDIRRLLVDECALVMPLVITILLLVVASGPYIAQFAQERTPIGVGVGYDLFHLQMILLLPLGAWLYHIYNQSPDVQGMMRASAGVVAAVSLVFYGGLIFAGKNLLYNTPNLALSHTLQVAKTIKDNDLVPWKNRLAVLGDNESKGYYTVAMGYGLSHYAVVRPVLPVLADVEGDFAGFFSALSNGEFSHVWIHTPTPLIRDSFGQALENEASYLYRITPSGLELVNRFAHAGYDHTNTPAPRIGVFNNL